jgi:hypothetical protein
MPRVSGKAAAQRRKWGLERRRSRREEIFMKEGLLF